MALYRIAALQLRTGISSPSSESLRTGSTVAFLLHRAQKYFHRPLCRVPSCWSRNIDHQQASSSSPGLQRLFLSTGAGEKQPKVSKKNRQASQEHGSVLNELMTVKEDAQPKQLTVGAKVVQASRDFTYILVILGGFVVAGFLLWSVGSEFFSSNSPQSIYTKALKRVQHDYQVREAMGDAISGHGELSGRGRRREPMHMEYVVDGVTYMRMKFYVKGALRSGTVQLDMKKNEAGKYELRFLFVELDGRPKRTIIIEDNR